MKIRLLSILFAVPFAFLVSNFAHADALATDDQAVVNTDSGIDNADLNLQEDASDGWRGRGGRGWGRGWGRGFGYGYGFGGYYGYGYPYAYGYPYYAYGLGYPYFSRVLW